MLAIARALMANPRLLLLDEPSMGLAPVLVEQIFQTIDDINRQGTTILLVEHVIDAVRFLCDRCLVMSAGRKIADGPTAAVLADPEVVRAYLDDADA